MPKEDTHTRDKPQAAAAKAPPSFVPKTDSKSQIEKYLVPNMVSWPISDGRREQLASSHITERPTSTEEYKEALNSS